MLRGFVEVNGGALAHRAMHFVIRILFAQSDFKAALHRVGIVEPIDYFIMSGRCHKIPFLKLSCEIVRIARGQTIGISSRSPKIVSPLGSWQLPLQVVAA